jgi:glycosyltransferase involved in cell wall biosynthesis
MLLLSVLIISIIERQEKLGHLLNRIKDKHDEEVEICVLIDNKKHTIGEKRNVLLSMVKGRYFTFLDDDDDIDDTYFDVLIDVLRSNSLDVDVVAFKQACYLKDETEPCFIVDADMNNLTNESIPLEGPWKQEYKRLCWHWCVFNTERFKSVRFDQCSYYEDIIWLQKIYPTIRTQLKIDKVLHKYVFLGDDSQTVNCLKKNLT